MTNTDEKIKNKFSLYYSHMGLYQYIRKTFRANILEENNVKKLN